MRKRQCREVFIGIRKLRKLGNHIHQFPAHQLYSLVHHNDICIISHITGSSSQMDDTCRFRTLLPISIDMAHDIMAHLFFTRSRHLVIDILRMALEFVNLLLCNDWPAILT